MENKLGEGNFGEIFLAYDPQHPFITLAAKMISLEKLISKETSEA